MMTQFLQDYENIQREEDSHEKLKHTLAQIFPHKLQEIFKEDESGVPEWAEQRSPEFEEEFEEIGKLFSLIGKGTIGLDQLINEDE